VLEQKVSTGKEQLTQAITLNVALESDIEKHMEKEFNRTRSSTQDKRPRSISLPSKQPRLGASTTPQRSKTRSPRSPLSPLASSPIAISPVAAAAASANFELAAPWHGNSPPLHSFLRNSNSLKRGLLKRMIVDGHWIPSVVMLYSEYASMPPYYPLSHSLTHSHSLSLV